MTSKVDFSVPPFPYLVFESYGTQYDLSGYNHWEKDVFTSEVWSDCFHKMEMLHEEQTAINLANSEQRKASAFWDKSY